MAADPWAARDAPDRRTLCRCRATPWSARRVGRDCAEHCGRVGDHLFGEGVHLGGPHEGDVRDLVSHVIAHRVVFTVALGSWRVKTGE